MRCNSLLLIFPQFFRIAWILVVNFALYFCLHLLDHAQVGTLSLPIFQYHGILIRQTLFCCTSSVTWNSMMLKNLAFIQSGIDSSPNGYIRHYSIIRGYFFHCLFFSSSYPFKPPNTRYDFTAFIVLCRSFRFTVQF